MSTQRAGRICERKTDILEADISPDFENKHTGCKHEISCRTTEYSLDLPSKKQFLYYTHKHSENTSLMIS